MNHLWSNWSHLGWIVVSSLAIYLWILLVLRLNGLRTFAAFSGYDFVITVAVGSIVASAVLSPSVSLLDGIIGTAALIVCQRAVTAGRRRLRRVERIVDNEPVVLLAHGQPIAGNLTRTGITLDDLRQKIRGQGIGRLDDVAAAILETTGDVSVIQRQPDGLDDELFAGVRDAHRLRQR
ncbi:MAG: DUF421 domain-containing protein [Ilumatobacteraceae bacterium]